MAQRAKNEDATLAFVMREFDRLADSIFISEPIAAALHGEAAATWKDRRLTDSPKAPKAVFLNGGVKYSIGELRRWRKERTQSSNLEYHEARRIAREKREAEERAAAAAAKPMKRTASRK